MSTGPNPLSPTPFLQVISHCPSVAVSCGALAKSFLHSGSQFPYLYNRNSDDDDDNGNKKDVWKESWLGQM